jgi:hypothetical protein
MQHVQSSMEKLGSPELVPFSITLISYDGRPSSPEGLFQNFPVELGGKTILIYIESMTPHLITIYCSDVATGTL